MSKLSQYGILYVDDELLALKYFEKGFAQDFKVLTASNAAEGWDLLQRHHPEIGIVMADQRMPGQTGVELLEKIRYAYPQVVRILATAYSDVESAIAGVNAGAIYRYVGKPWDVDQLRIDLMRALEYYGVVRERDQLLREKLAVLQQIILSNRIKNLAVLAAGLRFSLRNAVTAARRFAETIPAHLLEIPAADQSRGGVGRNFEAAIRKASDEVAQIAGRLKLLGPDSAQFSSSRLSLAALLEPIASAAAPGTLTLALDSSLPPITASPPQLTKMFLILVANLRAVLPEPATIRITATASSATEVPRIKVVLGDSGPTWAREQWLRLFAPFTPALDPVNELGLDLAICFFIAHHHGGTIEINGEPNARVTVHLALEPQTVEDVFEKGDLTELLQWQERGGSFLNAKV